MRVMIPPSADMPGEYPKAMITMMTMMATKKCHPSLQTVRAEGDVMILHLPDVVLLASKWMKAISVM